MRGPRAAVLAAPQRFEVVPIRAPIVGASDVAVAVAGCGICASNVPVWQGRPWFEYPLATGAPGHEAWGRAVEVGGEVSDVRVGDPVAVLCDHAFAELVVVPARDVVVLPPALTEVPFPGEALGCAFNVARRSGLRSGHTVAIVGVGFLGALLTAVATQVGARVIAVSRRPFALDMAKALGAHETIVMDDDRRVVEQVLARTNGQLCECVIEVVGEQRPLNVATELTGAGGTLVIAGYHQDGLRS